MFFLTKETIRDEESDLFYFLVAMFVLGFIGILIIYVWKQEEYINYILSLFSLDNFWIALLSALFIVVILQVYISILIKYDRGDFPNTKDSKYIVDLIQSSKNSKIVISISSAIFEEIFFRAALLGILASNFGALKGFLIVTIIFGSLHIPQYKGQYHYITYIFILGAFINLLFLWTGTLWGPILVHFLNNYLNLRLLKTGRIKISS